MAATSSIPAPELARLRPLLGEMNDLKRIRVAGHRGSLAGRGFARAWRALVAGDAPGRVAAREAAFAVASTRLGGVDAEVLAAAGLSPGAIRGVLADSIDAVADFLSPASLDPIREALADLAGDAPEASGELPPFAARLAAQPRAGATRPGHPRLILEPPEDHAEHCYLTAVYGVLLAYPTGADPATTFLAGLAHHLHNAYLPDSGFAGEELLGDHLGPIMARFTAEALGQIPTRLAGEVEAASKILAHADSVEARAFHAADVLDRVLQMEQYARVAGFELKQALDDLDLVHPGPLQAFHNEVLAAAGLLP